jgi:hypothetical protein
MAEWSWLHQPGAMTTGELAGAKDELSRALDDAPPDDPRRVMLAAQLGRIVKEQDTRRRTEMTSRGRHYERPL